MKQFLVYIHSLIFISSVFGLMRCSEDTETSPAPTLVLDKTLLMKTQSMNSLCFQIVNPPVDLQQDEITLELRQGESISTKLSITSMEQNKYCSLVSGAQLSSFRVGTASVVAQIQGQEAQAQTTIATRPLQINVMKEIDSGIALKGKVLETGKTQVLSTGTIVSWYQETGTRNQKMSCFQKNSWSQDLAMQAQCPYPKGKTQFSASPFFSDIFLDQLVVAVPDTTNGSRLNLWSCETSSPPSCTYSYQMSDQALFPPTTIKAFALSKNEHNESILILADKEGAIHIQPLAQLNWPGVSLEGASKINPPSVFLEQGDLDADENMDLLALDQTEEDVIDVRLFTYKKGTLGYDQAASESLFQVLKGHLISAITLGDVDQDGYADVIFSRGDSLFFAINQQDGTFRLDPFQLKPYHAASYLAFGDVDGDKKPELIVVSKDAPFLVAYPLQ